MRVGNVEIFEDALNAAVLAERAVQRVEGHIGTQLIERRAHLPVDIDARVTLKPSASSAVAQGSPEDRLTGRSDDQPPMRTATCFMQEGVPNPRPRFASRIMEQEAFQAPLR